MDRRKNDPNKTDWRKIKKQPEYQKAFREVQREQEEKRKKKREVFDMFFPEFRNIPIIWLVIGLVCFLFLLFSMIL